MNNYYTGPDVKYNMGNENVNMDSNMTMDETMTQAQMQTSIPAGCCDAPVCPCEPIYECPQQRECHRYINYEVPHIQPCNTKIINHHVYRHTFKPCYTCCEENVVCNVFDNNNCC